MVEHNGYCARFVTSAFKVIQVVVYKKQQSCFSISGYKYTYLYYGRHYREQDIYKMPEQEVQNILKKEIDRYIEKAH